MLILTACDLKFKPFTDCLVKSVLMNTPYAIRVDFLNTKGFSEDDPRRDYCANYRTGMLSKFWSPERHLLWVDADTIIRGDISELEIFLDDHAACAVHTPEMGQPGTYAYWLISTVGVSKNPEGRAFLDAWEAEQKRIYNEWYPSIMTCQAAFVNVVMTGKFKVKDITYKYSDKYFRDETPLWEAQGPRKREDPKWLAEMEKYK
jgi:hypothetical protein